MSHVKARQFLEVVSVQRRGKMSQLELDAAHFAFTAHEGQFRKYNFEPYICHPAEVAAIVSQVTNDPETLSAAWLHDVVEDCGVDLGLIRVQFGDQVATFVDGLTNPSQIDPELRKLNRVQRKLKDRDHLANAHNNTKTVKLADILSNINSLVYNDPSFARVWVKEKEALMPFLEGGAVPLYVLVKNNILNSKEYLGI